MDPAEERVKKMALPRPRGWTLGERKGMGKEKRNGKEGKERERRGGKEKGTKGRGGGRETRERKEARGKEGILCSCEFCLGETLVLARQLVVRAAYSYTHSDVATVDKINAICRRTAAMRAFAVSTLTSAQMMMIG